MTRRIKHLRCLKHASCDDDESESAKTLQKSLGSRLDEAGTLSRKERRRSAVPARGGSPQGAFCRHDRVCEPWRIVAILLVTIGVMVFACSITPTQAQVWGAPLSVDACPDADNFEHSVNRNLFLTNP
jgi:hypothetical protein